MKRTAKQVLQELVDVANGRRLTDCIGGHVRAGKLSDEQNAELVGKLVENLSDEDRELLGELRSEDIAEAFTFMFDRPRPEDLVLRVRKPVKLNEGIKE